MNYDKINNIWKKQKIEKGMMNSGIKLTASLYIRALFQSSLNWYDEEIGMYSYY